MRSLLLAAAFSVFVSPCWAAEAPALPSQSPQPQGGFAAGDLAARQDNAARLVAAKNEVHKVCPVLQSFTFTRANGPEQTADVTLAVEGPKLSVTYKIYSNANPGAFTQLRLEIDRAGKVTLTQGGNSTVYRPGHELHESFLNLIRSEIDFAIAEAGYTPAADKLIKLAALFDRLRYKSKTP